MMLRRNFLQNALLGSLAVPFLPVGTSSGVCPPIHDPYVLRNIPPGVTPEWLKDQYLERFPEMKSGVGPLNLVGKPGDVIAHAIAADFERGNIHRIGGWVYAETELKWCASV